MAEDTPPSLTDVAGIGPATAERLAASGITTVHALAHAPLDALAALPGFHRTRAVAAQQAAADLLRRAAAAGRESFPAAELVDAVPASEGKTGEAEAKGGADKEEQSEKKGQKKNKKDKKGKKGKKDKKKKKKGKKDKKSKKKKKKR